MDDENNIVVLEQNESEKRAMGVSASDYPVYLQIQAECFFLILNVRKKSNRVIYLEDYQ